MTRARPKFTLPPRGLIESESAGVLGLGMTEYTRLLPRLEAAGFPNPDPLTGRRDWKAIENWMDVPRGARPGWQRQWPPGQDRGVPPCLVNSPAIS